eukprot:TRINITY_DN47239_c0_g1_i1.p1 TRINITY_DN47239_c0_g1~~TRINITY_DN47239_c0_g1_i1.p1  ORF type:complete len:406 (+),score=65.24 TRINITY_DN47239_c0_g1_i1:103-1218(+)
MDHEQHPAQLTSGNIYESAFLPFSGAPGGIDHVTMAGMQAMRAVGGTSGDPNLQRHQMPPFAAQLTWPIADPGNMNNIMTSMPPQHNPNGFSLQEDLELELPAFGHFGVQSVAQGELLAKNNQAQKPLSSKLKKSSSKRTGGDSPVDNLKAKRKLRKNNREKQRRSEINERFEELANVLNIKQKNKAEKHTVLSEAINLIHSLQAENNELKLEKQELRAELTRLTSSLQQAFPMDPSLRPTQISEASSSRAPINLTETVSFATLTAPPAQDPANTPRGSNGDVMQGGEAMMALAAYAQMMHASPDGMEKLQFPSNLGGANSKTLLDASALTFSNATSHTPNESLSSRGARGVFSIGKTNPTAAEDLDLFSN